MKGFTQDLAFAEIDDCCMNYIMQKSLERFFNAQKKKTTDQDHYAIIRRTDLDADQKLNKEEFLEAIVPQEPYSKMLVRDRAKARGERKPVQMTPPKKKLAKATSGVKLIKSTRMMQKEESTIELAPFV